MQIVQNGRREVKVGSGRSFFVWEREERRGGHSRRQHSHLSRSLPMLPFSGFRRQRESASCWIHGNVMLHSTQRVTLKEMLHSTQRVTLESVKVGARMAVKNVLALLSEKHKILNIINKHQSNFPRSDRVLMVLSSLLSQLWVTGLFQTNGLIPAQWTCAPTPSGDLRWGGASNNTDWCLHCIPQDIIAHPSWTSRSVQSCVCEIQDPETVYMITHAIFVVLISGVPLSLLAFIC